MASTIFGATNPQSGSTQIYAFGATQFFWPWAQGNLWGSAPSAEATTQLKARGAGSLVGYGINVTANTYTSGNTTSGPRINGVNGNLIVTVAFGSTGLFSDTTHSDAVADGTPWNWYQTYAAVFNKTFTVVTVWAAYSATSGTKAPYGWTAPNSSGTTANAASTNYYAPGVGGTGSNTLSEETSETSQSKNLVRAAGTVSNLQRRVITNGNANSATLVSRAGGADGNQTITIAAAATGLFEDTTHSDTLTAGTTLDQRLGTGSGTVNLVTILSAYTFAPTGTNHDLIAGDTGLQLSYAAGATDYSPVLGYGWPLTTEATTQILAPFALGNISNLRINVGTNGSSTSATLRYRANGADGSEAVTIGAASTGTFEDTTHSDTASQGDKMGLKCSGQTSGAVVYNWTGLTVDTASPPATGRARRVLIAIG